MAPTVATAPKGASVAGTNGQGQQAPIAAGSLFGVPMVSTQPRLVPDGGNAAFAATATQASQINCPTTKLDQLDIVRGEKLYFSLANVWTAGAGKTLTKSPFYPASLIQQITFKLQAAYNTFNLTGPLAALIQAFRPMWGSNQLGQVQPDAFANPVNAVAPTIDVSGATTDVKLAVDIPFAWLFDEYFDLNPDGSPRAKMYDALVTPMFMAAQARVVTPTITLAPGLTASDLLGGGVTRLTADATSTFTSVGSAAMVRDAFWTGQNPAGNPPNFAWLYTRDYFTQPTQGQGQVGVLIQNTGVSVGQVLSLFGFVWDPQANAGLGGIVPMSSIAKFEILTGGSLQNIAIAPDALTDKMRSMYGPAVVSDMPSGCFVFDFAQDEDGGYISNSRAINTYVINGVQLNITFKAGLIPSATATVFMGVEALKYATS